MLTSDSRMIPKFLRCEPLLAIVVFTNFTDYLLLTAVVPIIPDLLVEEDNADSLNVRQPNLTALLHHTNNFSAILNHVDNLTDILAFFNETAHNETSREKTFIEKVLHIPVRAINENSKVGWLLGSKALVQLFVNPVVGYLSNRVSYRSLLLFGTCVFFVSSSIFAIGESYAPLLIARASQGIGSAATTIAGMSLIAEKYPQDDERSRAMGIAMGGFAIGILVGYPFGGLLYAISGKAAPFVGIILFCLLNIACQFWFIDGSSALGKAETRSSSVHKLLADPYILICAGALMITSMSLAVLESTVPLWVIDTMDAQQWQLGLIFIPDSIGYLLGTNAFPVIAKIYGRWIFTIASMFLIGVGMILIPLCTKIGHLLLPHLSLGLGVGVTDAAIMPLLALLVDERHISTYGSVYAIVQLAVCLAYSLGPAIAGQIVKAAGFKWAMWGMSILNLIFLPLCVFLKSPPVSEDVQCILEDIRSEDDTKTRKVNSKYQSFNLE